MTRNRALRPCRACSPPRPVTPPITSPGPPPINGPAVEGYEVRVAGAFTGTLTTAERFLTGVGAPGTYAISVAATNACGVGPATAPVTVVLR
jgi:hypothetical protein